MPQRDRIAEPWGTRTPYEPGDAWPLRASADRLTRPLIREGDHLVETDGDTAMSRIVG